jgi:hypothetical protein
VPESCVVRGWEPTLRGEWHWPLDEARNRHRMCVSSFRWTVVHSETIRRMGWENCIRMAEDKKCTPHMSPCTLLGDPEQLERIFTDPRLTFDLRQEREEISWENARACLRRL